MGKKYGQWWNSKPEDRFRSYYMTLRVCYGYPALEAYARAKENFAKYPEFFSDPCTTLRNAISERRASR